MRRSISFWPVCAVLVCMLVAFLWSSGNLVTSIRDVEGKYAQSRLAVTQLTNEKLALENTLEQANTDSFIENQARTLYGYMRKDEIRFVIVNPEVLYGSDEVPTR